MEEQTLQCNGKIVDTGTERVSDVATIDATPSTAAAPHPKKRTRELARHVRYRLKNNSAVTISVASSSGETWTADVLNCSINGVLVRAVQPIDTFVSQRQILTDVCLHIGDVEYFLGRLAVQRVELPDAGSTTMVALSTIDRRLPLDGPLGTLLLKLDQHPVDVLAMEYGTEKFTYANFEQPDDSDRDMLARCENFSTFFSEVARDKKFGYYYPRSSAPGARVSIKRSQLSPDQSCLMFGSNDYLGLSSHAEVVNACTEATERFGVGSTGTAPTAGTTVLHEELCQEIARLHGREDALVFPSGYGTNIGIVSGLARADDLLVADRFSHASLHDGMKLSGATIANFKHNDMRHLKRVLERQREAHNGCLIITEGLFSMGGDFGKLDEIVPLAREYEARILVDQGHCFGLYGQAYTGTAEHLGVGDAIDIPMGLFSKTVGTLGGFVTGSRALMNWYRAYARSHMFATSFPAGNAAATLKSLEIIQRGELQKLLAANIRYFVRGLVELGIPISPDHASPIIPVLIGDEQKLGIVFQHLKNNGVFALPVVYPVVPRRRCQFRFSLSARFTTSDLDQALKFLDEALCKAKL